MADRDRRAEDDGRLHYQAFGEEYTTFHNADNSNFLQTLHEVGVSCSDDVVEPPAKRQRIIENVDLSVNGAVETSLESQMRYCFGMINSFSVELLDADKTAQCINAVLGESRTLLNQTDLTPLGKIDEQATEILQSFRDDRDFELQMEVRLQPKLCGRTKPRRNASPDAILFVILYGAYDRFDDVGQYLQEHEIYLQDPVGCDRIVAYRNPHRLSGSDLRPVMTSIDVSTSMTTLECITNAVDVLDGFENGETLEEAEAPRQLATSLHRHQKQALMFALKRERGWDFLTPAQDVWTIENENGSPRWYLNNITGRREQEAPPTFQGGIIADHMGLGKSLVMIALIAASTHMKVNNSGEVKSSELILEPHCTLLIVPSTLIENWEEQIVKHTHRNTIRWRRHHGKQRLRSVQDFTECDLVITSYQTIASEWKRSVNEPSIMFSTGWWRLILDEAHCIRDASSLTTEAVLKIRAQCRWAVTGTPIQNKLADLASLLQFLQVHPYSEPAVFHADITQLWKENNGETAIARLKKLLGFIMLRRSQSTIELPPRKDLIHVLHFSPEESRAYDAAKRTTIKALDDQLMSGTTEKRSYLNALQRVNALRMICNLGVSTAHLAKPYVPSTKAHLLDIWTHEAAQSVFNNLIIAGQAVCCNCAEEVEALNGEDNSQPLLTQCLYIWCGKCKDPMCSYTCVGCGKSPICPQLPVSASSASASVEATNSQLSVLELGEQLPTKIRALQADLLRLVNTKSIVLSFWTSTLDVVENALMRAGVRCLRFDGKVAQKHRGAILHQFESDPTVEVLLMSITCGSVGLTLTAASRAYLMEPHWNPTVEEQALARIHRLGQTKEVTTIRYIIKGSFEEHVQKVQDRKKQLAELLLSKKGTSESNLAFSRLHQLRSLLD